MTKAVRIATWYRVELDEAGKLVSCEPTKRAGDETDRVFYFRAKSPEAAGRKAFNEYARTRLAARRASYRDEGRCACGRKRDVPGCMTCSVCQKTVKRSRERRELRAEGKTVPELSVRDALRQRRAAEDDEIRRDVLRVVMRRFCEMKASDFKRWLEGEIKKLAGRNAA